MALSEKPRQLLANRGETILIIRVGMVDEAGRARMEGVNRQGKDPMKVVEDEVA